MVNGHGAPRVPCQESGSEAQLTAQSCSPASPPPGEAQSALPAELSGWPSCPLSETQLGDLELLTSGAFAPLRGYLDAGEAATVAEYGTLPDGTSWPVPVTLDLAADAVPADADHLVLQDQEGSPLAVLTITERRALPGGDPGLIRLAGPVTALREPEHGPFRTLRWRPEDVNAAADVIAARLRKLGVPHQVYEPELYLSIPLSASDLQALVAYLRSLK